VRQYFPSAAPAPLREIISFPSPLREVCYIPNNPEIVENTLSTKLWSYMSRILFISVSILFMANTSFAFSKEYKMQPFSISGTFKGLTTGRMVIGYMKHQQLYVRDTVTIKDGKFFWKGAMQQTSRARLYLIDENGQAVEGEETEIYMSPGNMKMTIVKSRLNEIVMEGSAAQADLLAYRKFMKQTDAVCSNVYDSLKYYRGLLKAQPQSKQLIETEAYWEKKMDSSNEVRFAQERRFIDTHPNAMVSGNLLCFQWGRASVDTVRVLYNVLSTEVKESYDGITIGNYVKRWPVSEAPDFKVADIHGDTLQLNDYKGKKMVLLDFWASWCVPCRADNPGLRNLYAKYATSGLEIISISVWERKREHLDKAIAEDSLSAWRHVPSSMADFDSVVKLYGVQPIPVKMLISKEGQIIYRNEGSGLETLEEKLEEIFGF
jgi:thiol-disulfide isomerase/thioredoxin